MKAIRSFLAIVLSFICLTANASAGTSQTLKDIFDEFNYRTTVEWDQKDPAFLNDAISELTLSLSQLKAQGVTNNEITAFVLSQTSNETERNQVEQLLKDPNQTQNIKAVLDALNRNHSQGASFNPINGPYGQVVALVVAGVATYVLIALISKVLHL